LFLGNLLGFLEHVIGDGDGNFHTKSMTGFHAGCNCASTSTPPSNHGTKTPVLGVCTKLLIT
jgi:hypothetical protein